MCSCASRNCTSLVKHRKYDIAHVFTDYRCIRLWLILFWKMKQYSRKQNEVLLYMFDQKKKLSIKCMWMTQKRRKMIDVLSSEPHSRVLSTQPHECIVHKHCWRPVEADRGRKMPAVSFKACYQGIQIPLYNKVLYYYYLPRASISLWFA